MVFILAVVPEVDAHHILGIPHYTYDEMYPHTPILTFSLVAGPYDVKMRGYPGMPRPGERCTLHIDMKRLDNDAVFQGEVTLQVMQDHWFGEDPVIYGPSTAKIEERVFKFYPEFPEAANYTVRFSFEVDGVPWTVDLPMVAGEPGSPWTVVGGVGFGLFGFLIVIRAIRIKRQRQLRLKTPTKIKSASV